MEWSEAVWDYGIVVVLIIIGAALVINTNNDNEDRFASEARYAELTADLSRYETKLFFAQRNLANVWLGTLSPEAEEEFDQYFTNNDAYHECLAEEELQDVTVSSNYYGYGNETAPSNYLVLTYRGHDLVISHGGYVSCYEHPIMNNLPEARECSVACNLGLVEANR